MSECFWTGLFGCAEHCGDAGLDGILIIRHEGGEIVHNGITDGPMYGLEWGFVDNPEHKVRALNTPHNVVFTWFDDHESADLGDNPHAAEGVFIMQHDGEFEFRAQFNGVSGYNAPYEVHVYFPGWLPAESVPISGEYSSVTRDGHSYTGEGLHFYCEEDSFCNIIPDCFEDGGMFVDGLVFMTNVGAFTASGWCGDGRCY